VGNLAGFVSPYLVGAVKDATGSPAIGIYLVAASLAAGGVLVLVGVRRLPGT
jgi:nitrate/nitrite transporter NarK